jgi:hypothetical protein
MTASVALVLLKNEYLGDSELMKQAKFTAIKALEKQIPYRPKEYEDKFYACKCGNILLMKWEKYPTELMPKSEGLPYCLGCGQKLDWSDEE